MLQGEKYANVLGDWLREEGFTHCFMVAGGGCMHLIDAFRSRFNCIPVVHEVTAGIAAEHFNECCEAGRAFALVTTGPGVTNIVSAVAGCWAARTPRHCRPSEIHRPLDSAIAPAWHPGNRWGRDHGADYGKGGLRANAFRSCRLQSSRTSGTRTTPRASVYRGVSRRTRGKVRSSES